MAVSTIKREVSAPSAYTMPTGLNTEYFGAATEGGYIRVGDLVYVRLSLNQIKEFTGMIDIFSEGAFPNPKGEKATALTALMSNMFPFINRAGKLGTNGLTGTIAPGNYTIAGMYFAE